MSWKRVTPSHECSWYPVLASHHDGVLAFSVRALPMAIPVPYAVVDHDVVLRVGRAGLPFTAIDGQVVTLTAHDDGASGHGGRLVAVTGRAYAVTDAALQERCARLALPASAASDVYVRIPMDLVSTFDQADEPAPAH